MVYGTRAPATGNVVLLLGVALALAGVACGGESNNPLGISTGGGGAGGSASTAGRGGAAGAAGASMAEGGAGGTEPAEPGDAGAMGGSGPAGAGGSGGGRPPGCPEPSPIPVPGQTIVIQSINFDTAEIILRNPTSSPQTIVLGRQGWQWCFFPMYWSFTDTETRLELAPGETYSFVAINNQSGPVNFIPDEGEMAIYPGVQLFDDYEAVQAFVAWGDVQAFRESYAVQKGYWTFGERIEIGRGHAGFIVTGETHRASGYTSAPARCLVP